MQRVSLASIEPGNRPLVCADLLKEHLLDVFKHDGQRAINMLDYFVGRAACSRLKPFVKLARPIRDRRETIVAALTLRVIRVIRNPGLWVADSSY